MKICFYFFVGLIWLILCDMLKGRKSLRLRSETSIFILEFLKDIFLFDKIASYLLLLFFGQTSFFLQKKLFGTCHEFVRCELSYSWLWDGKSRTESYNDLIFLDLLCPLFWAPIREIGIELLHQFYKNIGKLLKFGTKKNNRT